MFRTAATMSLLASASAFGLKAAPRAIASRSFTRSAVAMAANPVAVCKTSMGEFKVGNYDFNFECSLLTRATLSQGLHRIGLVLIHDLITQSGLMLKSQSVSGRLNSMCVKT